MKEKGNQTIFLTGNNTKYYREIENEYQQQKDVVKKFVKNSYCPTNDLWVAAISQAVGKIARATENNDDQALAKLILKFISQLIVWLEIFENPNFDEVTLPKTHIHNPSFNTILVKMVGELSRAILSNDNQKVRNKIAVFRSFCDQWIERIDNTDNDQLKRKPSSVRIVEEFWEKNDALSEKLEEIFSEVNNET
ncbi:MAG: hypothetical protein KGD59_06895 [Candidatus Heimdallarchaeota archaeon]|nr:hypothetical protein [Candidatus Heimdallarchaeota archaeon]MBY8994259.1 hypothetical protein [Candidatus Heimdallarchaeota archaeon]